MSSDFGYINARVRGLSSKLLGDDFFVSALGDSDFRAFVSALAQSPYGSDLEQAQSRAAGLQMVDQAVAHNFFRTTRSLLSFSDGEAHDLIALVLRRYDLANLKAIARAKHAGRDAADVSSALLPAGSLKPGLLASLAAEPDLPAVAQALAVTRHPLGRAFSRATRRYAQSGDLYDFELTLDRAFFANLMAELKDKSVPDAFLRHLRLEIDATNLRTALKLRGTAVNSDDLFVRGGREISRSTFDAILNDSGKGALSALSGGAFAAVAEADGLAEAEPAIRAAIDASAVRAANADPLDIGVVLKFLRRKEAEGAKLRLLARGKFYDVPRDQLERELLHA